MPQTINQRMEDTAKHRPPVEVPVVVVTTNAERHLPNWIASVQALRSDRVCPVPCVADNGSWDRTAPILWEAISDNQINRSDVFWLRRNEWFNSAQNYAFRVLGARNKYRYIATLNEDATADPGWLDGLVSVALNSEARFGMFCGPILTPDRKRISSAGHCLRGLDGAFLDVDYGLLSTWPTLKSNAPDYEPFSPCFAASLWSVGLLKAVGFPDNDQPIYYDDVELAYKARICGWSARFVPEAIAQHPLPRKATQPQRLAAQRRGRLAVVARYFPDPERSRILGAVDGEIVATVENETESLFLRQPAWGDASARERVFEWWKDRNGP